jgi:sortase A
MRRLIRDISSVLMISGALLVIDAAVTLLWQEPITAVIGKIEASQVNKKFLSYQSAPLTELDRHTVANLATTTERVSFLARQEARQVGTGDAIGQIDIPTIHSRYNIIQGTDTSSLEKGAGHYPTTSLPGLGQTVGIAGHRTTYLAPFRHIDALKPGDHIVVTMRYAKFIYVVQYHQIVKPTALWVTRNMGYERLVLSACNPLYSAAQRIIVFARLAQMEPLGAARAEA